jgi:hypothetical protein
MGQPRRSNGIRHMLREMEPVAADSIQQQFG